VFQVGNRLRHDRLRDGKMLGCLAHRPAFDDGHQDAEVAKLEPATDPLAGCSSIARWPAKDTSGIRSSFAR
jgi:hypothetical protein